MFKRGFQSTRYHKHRKVQDRSFMNGKQTRNARLSCFEYSIWSDCTKVAEIDAIYMQNFARNVDVLTQGLKAGISGLMNLANQGSDPASGVFFVNFNQDCT